MRVTIWSFSAIVLDADSELSTATEVHHPLQFPTLKRRVPRSLRGIILGERSGNFTVCPEPFLSINSSSPLLDLRILYSPELYLHVPIH